MQVQQNRLKFNWDNKHVMKQEFESGQVWTLKKVQGI